jgi:4-hydroxy-tetrahydrodipicolinate reductase
MARVIITGAKGRMGKALVERLPQFTQLEIVGQINRGDNLDAVIPLCDVVIDFSSHDATPAIVEACAKNEKAVVIGTTGHSISERAKIENYTSQISMVWTSNFSTGVNTLFWLTRKAAEILGTSFDLEIIEMHHRMKKDAPSGTAKSLEQILKDVRKRQLGELRNTDIVSKYGRTAGIIGERTVTEIGVHSVRGGDVIGDHTVIFAALGERLELTHKASSRDTFAQGALRAAIWAAFQQANGKPGLYDMQDVLGLK